MILLGARAKKSDILLVTQFGSCTGGELVRAYGFSSNNEYLEIIVSSIKKN